MAGADAVGVLEGFEESRGGIFIILAFLFLISNERLASLVPPINCTFVILIAVNQ